MASQGWEAKAEEKQTARIEIQDIADIVDRLSAVSGMPLSPIGKSSSLEVAEGDQVHGDQVDTGWSSSFHGPNLRSVTASWVEQQVESRTRQAAPDIHNIVPRTWMQARMLKITESTGFLAFVGAAIFANSIFLGVIVHLDSRRALRHEEKLPWEKQVEIIFMFIFPAELLMRIAAEQGSFFVGPHRNWNWFDFVVVMSSIFEMFGTSLNVSFVRCLRVLRLVRVMRVIRLVQFLRELRLMVCSILCCGLSLVWAFLLILLAVYLFSIYILETVRMHVREGSPGNLDLSASSLPKYYDGIFQTMLYLFVALLGGMDWYDLAEPVVAISWVHGLAFVLFIAFVLLGMLNVLTGIFVESSSNISDIDQELVIQEQVAAQNSAVHRVKTLFRAMDVDGDGKLTWAELQSGLKDEHVHHLLESTGITTFHACTLYKLLDADGDGLVGIEEFVDGCMRFQGGATAVDIAIVLHDNSCLRKDVRGLSAATHALSRRVAEVTQSVDASPLGSRAATKELAQSNHRAAAARESAEEILVEFPVGKLSEEEALVLGARDGVDSGELELQVVRKCVDAGEPKRNVLCAGPGQ